MLPAQMERSAESTSAVATLPCKTVCVGATSQLTLPYPLDDECIDFCIKTTLCSGHVAFQMFLKGPQDSLQDDVLVFLQQI